MANLLPLSAYTCILGKLSFQPTSDSLFCPIYKVAYMGGSSYTPNYFNFFLTIFHENILKFDDHHHQIIREA